MRKANSWAMICEDPESGELEYAIVEVSDALTLPVEVHRRVARGAATRMCGWVRLMAPADKMPMHREPVRVLVTEPDKPGGLRTVFVGEEMCQFRLTPSRQEVTA
jgi:hypothetical protein